VSQKKYSAKFLSQLHQMLIYLYNSFINTLLKMCNKANTKYPTSTQMHSYTTLWNINIRIPARVIINQWNLSHHLLAQKWNLMNIFKKKSKSMLFVSQLVSHVVFKMPPFTSIETLNWLHYWLHSPWTTTIPCLHSDIPVWRSFVKS